MEPEEVNGYRFLFDGCRRYFQFICRYSGVSNSGGGGGITLPGWEFPQKL